MQVAGCPHGGAQDRPAHQPDPQLTSPIPAEPLHAARPDHGRGGERLPDNGVVQQGQAAFGPDPQALTLIRTQIPDGR